MENLADEARLRRGRSYAANGNVLKLVIKDGTAKAMVEGSYEPWYNVEISFKPLERKDRDALSALIDKDPMLVGRIAAGELPMELIERLEKAGVRLLPTRWQDMRRSCSCPDYGDPCKHMAAVYYVLAQEIDRDPSVLFRLRGVDLAGRFSSEGAPVIANPLDLRMVRPWKMNANGKMPQLEGIGAYGKAIIRLLPPPPPLVPYDLKNALADFYDDLDQHWERILGMHAAGESSEARVRAFAQSKISLQLPKAQGSPKETHPYFLVTVAGGKKERLSPLETVRLCLAVDQNEGSAGYVFLRTFSHVMRMILAAGAIIPDIEARPAGSPRESDRMRVIWKPAQFGADVRGLLDALEAVTPPAQPSTSATKVPDAHSTVLLLAADLFSAIVGELRYLPKNVSDISHPVTTALFRGEAADVSSPLHRSLPKAMDSWLSVFDVASSKFKYELVIKHGTSRANPTALPRYALSATVKLPSAPSGQARPSNSIEPAKRLALSKAAQKIGPEILTFPAMLASFVPELVWLGSKTSVVLDEEALSRFVIESAPLLARLGVTVVLPKELKTLLKPRPVLSAKKRKGSGNLVSFMDMNSMLSFEWNVSIGDVVISVAEFERLVAAGSELVRFRDDYLRLEASEAASILERIKKGPKPDSFDALKEYLTGDTVFDETLEKTFAALMPGLGSRSRKGGKRTKGAEDDSKTLIPFPAGLCATLRPYQERGFRWIATTLERGFGCILADDMGLGKTVQAIASILRLKEKGTLGRGALVCAPATLLTNWERELERFAPSLSISTYYGASRRTKAVDITLTSYETFQRDQKKLEDREWDLVVLDEAHLIKNPDTKRSKALKLVKSSRRLALSGTPVENHLGELWSIFDFVLPGYLRTLDRFARDYRRPIEVEKSAEQVARLRCVTAPFLMRRLKLDKSIIADLP
ncbi:MAG: SNF2-related protein, partial [Candidatus Shapirobacteria bacterium]